MQHRAPALAHAGNFGTREVDLSIHRHQHLHRFNLRVMRAQRAPRVHKLVAQVLDGVTKNLQRMACLGRDASPVLVALVCERSGNGC